MKLTLNFYLVFSLKIIFRGAMLSSINFLRKAAGLFMFLSISMSAHALDVGFERNAKNFYNSADVVVIGFFEAQKSIVIGDDVQTEYVRNFRVTDVFKGVRVNGTRIKVSMASEIRSLNDLEPLAHARDEELRLLGCKQELLGRFVRDPRDKTLCEESISKIEKKLEDKTFRAKATLGYLIERGRLGALDRDTTYLVFLRRVSDSEFALELPQHFIKIDDVSLEELRSIVVPM